MTTSADISLMSRALELAGRGRFWASPNPHVGCVLVRDGEVIGEGFTQPAGGNHAEIEALNAAGDAAGATAYVTLEPCAHQGRTGPCSEALIAAGVSRVVAAMEDPNPQVAGGGLEKLRAAGIVVEVGLLESQARETITGFALRMTRGRGRLRIKLAMSLDGRTAMASGESKWITGPAARADVQRLRAESCTIVTGIGSILADDSALTVRVDELNMDAEQRGRAIYRTPLRVVVDSELRTPGDARLLREPGEVVIIHGSEAAPPAELTRRGVSFEAVPGSDQGLDPLAVSQILAARQCNEILVESGPRLAGAFLRRGLVDELVVYMAPTLMGSTARPLLELPLDTMDQKIALQCKDLRRVGQDWRFVLVPDNIQD